MGPLPDVANHVVKAVGVWLVRSDRAGSDVAVGAGVLIRKRALPNVGPMRGQVAFAARPVQLVAPRKSSA